MTISFDYCHHQLPSHKIDVDLFRDKSISMATLFSFVLLKIRVDAIVSQPMNEYKSGASGG